MRFIFSWDTWLAAIWSVALLLQIKKAAWWWGIWRSFNKASNHDISYVIEVIAQYSASAKDLDKVCCYFDFYEINDLSRNKQNPVIEFWVSTQLAQSKLQKTLRWKFDCARKKKLYPSVPFKYLNILWIASRCGCLVIYWLSTWTEKAKSGWEIVRYINLPISLQ